MDIPWWSKQVENLAPLFSCHLTRLSKLYQNWRRTLVQLLKDAEMILLNMEGGALQRKMPTTHFGKKEKNIGGKATRVKNISSRSSPRKPAPIRRKEKGAILTRSQDILLETLATYRLALFSFFLRRSFTLTINRYWLSLISSRTLLW